MVTKNITIRFAVPLGHLPGDTALLYSNNGSGDIDWQSPVTPRRFDLFPGGAGNYGFGMSPFGESPFGQPYPERIVRGFGELPFGMHPFGSGAVLIEEVVRVAECGVWTFAFKCFDAVGNAHVGTPAEASVEVHVAGPQPAGLKFVGYDPLESELTLAVVDPFSADAAVGGRPTAADFADRSTELVVGDAGGALPDADLPIRLTDPDLGEEEE